MNSAVTQHTPIARKKHRCFCCGEEIPPRTAYIRRSGVQHGEGWWCMKMHPECNAATRAWRDEDWETFDQGTLERPVTHEQ